MTFSPGVAHPKSKFTEAEIKLIRDCHANYLYHKEQARRCSPKVMAEKMGINPSSYWEIVSYQSYKNVKD